ncbi:hypothetical protein [Clostridium butyricum]|uniref:hypothetical protein n=1 Tax=Clostridium butyricum TaxID=1492 RepID=UPI000903C15A|nr:hypothetical protein [Clostridium butyricum]APF23914.1 hypothetical protein NPD4_2752 [Clostridium butyricum]
MVNFEFLENESYKSGYKSFYVKVNGIEDKESHAFSFGKEISINLYQEEVCTIVLNEKINNLLKGNIESIEIPMERIDLPLTIEENDVAKVHIKKQATYYELDFKFQYDYEFWKRGYTIPEIVDKIKDISKNKNMLFEIDDSETTLNGFHFCKRFESDDVNTKLKDEVQNMMKIVKEIFEVAYNFVDRNDDRIYFEFEVDKDVQTIYKQYLIYFEQFLDDIGIDSRMEIKDEINKILLSVEPEDKNIALKNIRDCLEIYLNLIDNREIQVYEEYSNVAVMQLKSNIEHLKSQLMLARTIIEQQQISINLLKNMTVSSPELQDEEINILDGAIKVKEFEYKGLSINPAKILKLLKRRNRD